MKNAAWIPAVVVAAATVILAVGISVTGKVIPRERLIADVKQFASTVESVHPDPYSNMGGRIEFHRNLHKVIAEIPESGLTTEEFYFLLCPFVTSIGDSHTWLRAPDEYSYGLPLILDVVDELLYVYGVPSEDFRYLLGARLESVEGVPVSEIIDRAYDFVSAENVYQVLRNLRGSGLLFNKWYLDQLVPACQGKDRINISLLRADGTTTTQVVECSKLSSLDSYVWTTSQYSLPSRKHSDFVYSFVDSSKQTALLVIDDLNTYREAFEMWQQQGRFIDCADDAADLYRRYHSSDPPREELALIAGLPSATELFMLMCGEMKEAGTDNLIIDLRRNGGGNSAMAEILIYFLYGKELLLEIEARQTEVLRCSPTYIERHPGVSLQDMSRRQGHAINPGDYVFDPYCSPEGQSNAQAVATEFEKWVSSMPTFFTEYVSADHSRYYSPENVYVLSSEQTFSSGYTVMCYLHRAGAKIVGIPSAQAGNCYGEAMDFELENSGLYFTVSCKYYENFPDDPIKGKVLMPDYPLTYEILASYNFDRNASLLYALELSHSYSRDQ